MNLYRNFLESVKSTYKPESRRAIISALRAAAFELRNHKRYDGSPLMLHSVNVAHIVCDEIGLGGNSVVSSLLHDVARMGLIGEDKITSKFGARVTEILKGMNSISAVDPKTSSLQVGNFKDLIVSYSSDPRVILIKMADRLEVMRSLAMFPELKRNKKSWETIHLYSQLAHKLGLYNIKSEMEDLSLRYLEPKDYKHIRQRLIDTDAERKTFISEFIKPIEQKLDSLNLKYHLKSRTKSIYSIWRKMKKQSVTFDQVYDIFALRIIIDCPKESEKIQCWTAFSVVTEFYTPNPDRMRDWISIPKSNGYESLHTTVVTSEGKWVEVQIRTERMDQVAERGVAAHWRYKGVSSNGLSTEEWLNRLRSIVETTSEDEQINEEFDISLNTREIFVFTPNGDLRKLQEGATMLDFAFDIHSDLGITCTGGRINGRKVPIRKKLHSGDIVEITTSKNQYPKSDWLNIAVTTKARSRIRLFLREKQASSANLGREELERKLKNWKIPLTLDEAVTQLTKHYKVKTGLEIYSFIANEELPMHEIKACLLNDVHKNVYPTEPNSTKELSPENHSADLIINDTVKGLDYKLAKCCNPIHGDDIFGFVTINSGITIHRTNCPNAVRLNERYPYRKVTANWGASKADGNSFLAVLKITSEDNPGLVNTITEIINKQSNAIIRSVNTTPTKGQIAGTISIEVINIQAIDTIIFHLKKIKGLKASRIK